MLNIAECFVRREPGTLGAAGDVAAIWSTLFTLKLTKEGAWVCGTKLGADAEAPGMPTTNS